MPTRSMTATIFGVDKASPAFDKVGKSANTMAGETEKSSTRMGNAFSKGAKMAAGALAAIGFTQFVTDSVKAFTEAQAQTQKLIDAYDKFPAMRDVTVQSFQDISSELMNVTKFDDDATNAAAALLGQFGLTGTQIQKLIPLVQDYATATGKDLNTSATDLGKALLGQTRALKEVGINYKSTGDKATDFTNITGLLRDKVGGFAENEGKTAAGQLEILKNQFGEVQEKIGSALVPALTELGKIAVPILEGIGTGANALVTIVEKIPGPVKLALGALIGFKIFQQTAVFEKLATGARGFRDEMVLQQGLAKMEGVELSGMGAAAAVARPKVSALGKTLAKGGALAGGIWVVSSIADAFGKLSDNSDRAGQSAHALADALVEAGGAWDDTAKKQRTAQIEGMDSFDTLIKAGVSYSDIMAGMTGDTDAFNALLGKIGETGGGDLLADVIDEMTKMHGAVTTGAEDLAKQKVAYNELQSAAESAALSASATASNYVGQAKAQWESLGGAQDEARTSAVGAKADYELLGASLSTSAQMQDESKSSAVELANAWRNTGEASKSAVNPIGAMTDEIGKFDKAASDADTRLKFFTLSVDALAGRDVSLEEATKLLNDQVRNLKQGFEDSTKATKGHVESLIKADGVIDTTTEAGSNLYDTVSNYRQAYDAATNAARDHALKTGDASAAIRAARTEADKARDAFIEQAHAMGISRDDAEKMATAMGILEGKKLTAKTLGITVADKKAKDAVAYYDSWQPKNKSFTITAIENLVQAKGPDGSIFHGRFADGGWVGGEGTGTSDSNLARVSKGEFIVQQKAASKFGPLLEAINRAPGFADGGWFGASAPTVFSSWFVPGASADDVVDELKSLRSDVVDELQSSTSTLREAIVAQPVGSVVAELDSLRATVAHQPVMAVVAGLKALRSDVQALRATVARSAGPTSVSKNRTLARATAPGVTA